MFSRFQWIFFALRGMCKLFLEDPETYLLLCIFLCRFINKPDSILIPSDYWWPRNLVINKIFVWLKPTGFKTFYWKWEIFFFKISTIFLYIQHELSSYPIFNQATCPNRYFSWNFILSRAMCRYILHKLLKIWVFCTHISRNYTTRSLTFLLNYHNTWASCFISAEFWRFFRKIINNAFFK